MPTARLLLILLPVVACLGSVHAYSVFLAPLEERFALSRAQSSLGYSAALVCLTAAVLLAPPLYARVRAGVLMGFAAALAGMGALLAGLAPGYAAFLLGYGVLFGLGNGLGYGFALFYAAAALPDTKGFAMGAVTAAYGLGAALSPGLFAALLPSLDLFGALGALAILLFVLGALAWRGLPDVKIEPAPRSKAHVGARLILMWLAYGAAVLAGLMTIGHATGIAEQSGMTAALWLAPIAVAAANTAASLLGGVAADRVRPALLLVAIALASAATLAWLALGSGSFVLIGLALIGACYGATIAIWPVLIAGSYGAAGAQVYGLVFTAWGAAGLAGPVLAGAVFDRTGGYVWALTGAAGLALLSAGLMVWLGQAHAGNPRGGAQ